MASPFVGEVFQREDRLWDFRVRSTRNGKIVAVAGNQGYNRRGDAIDTLHKLLQGGPHIVQHPDGYYWDENGELIGEPPKPRLGERVRRRLRRSPR